VAGQTKNLNPTSNPSEKFSELLNLAEKGDPSTLPALRMAFNDPNLVESYGNLARQAERSFVDAMAGDNLGNNILDSVAAIPENENGERRAGHFFFRRASSRVFEAAFSARLSYGEGEKPCQASHSDSAMLSRSRQAARTWS
jgi:hypothetical protein